MMDQPTKIELITAVREFIEQHAIPKLSGHTAFHARVAANALAIVARELDYDAQEGGQEVSALKTLLHRDGSREELNRELCRQIRSDEIALDNAALRDLLISSTLAKVAVDQPNYSGYKSSPHRK